MDFSGCLGDDSLGPTVKGCRADFDFTIKFENIFLSILPAAIFVAGSLPRLVYLTRRPAIVSGAPLKILKLARPPFSRLTAPGSSNKKQCIIAVIATLQLALLVLSCTRLGKFEALFISSAATGLASALCLSALSLLEHSRSPRPSILINAYLFLTLIFDVTRLRTLWLVSSKPDEVVFSRLSTAAVVVRAVLIFVESQHKTRWMRWNFKDHSPEETSGLFGLGAFVWLNQLFLRGFRKVLATEDLIPLDQTLASEVLHAKLDAQVEKDQLRGKKSKHWLLYSLVKMLAVPLLLPIAPRIALAGFQFCQPFLISSILDNLQKPETESSRNNGYGLIGATLLVYTGIAVSSTFYWYFQERAGAMARATLAAAVYKKTTETKLTAADDSAALTLMSTDVERIRASFLFIQEYWVNLVEIALASWLLQRQLGAAFVAPLVVILCCAAGSIFLTRYTGARQKAWMAQIQKRVGLTSNVIAHMKHLKISGLAAPVEAFIQQLRVDELKVGSRWRIMAVMAALLAFIPLTISPVVTFAVTSRTLDVNTIFTSYSFLLLLTTPLLFLIQSIPSMLAAFVCLGRIQEFLDKEPRIDFRDSPPDLSGEKNVLATTEAASVNPPALTISGGSFGWVPDKTNLRGLDLHIPTSRLTVVVGPVASGKSTLCKVLLGETPVFDGQVILGRNSRRIGYCDQSPYLSNATIRQNIVGFSPFNQERYNEVIKATMLEPDLVVLPQGDQSKIGSNGISLSGGQKQRVSMARALYLETDFYVLDDILSGLDADTEEQVFRRVFGPDGLLQRRHATTVLCTHSVRHLPNADRIIALSPEGQIVEQGTWEELMLNNKYVQSLGIKTGNGEERDDGGVGETDVTEERPVSAPAKTLMPATATEQSRMTGDRTVYKHYFSSVGIRPFVIFVLFGCGYGGFHSFGAIWLKFWSEDISSPNPVHPNAFYIGLYALFQLCCVVSFFMACIMCLTSMIELSGAKMHKDVLRTVITAPLAFFTTTDTGIVTNLFSQDMTLIDSELPMSLLNLSLDLTTALGQAAVIATSSPFLAISYPFLMAILFGIQKFYLRTSRQLRLLDLEAKSPLYTHFIDTIKSVATMRAFGWTQEGIRLNFGLINDSQQPAYLLTMIQRWLAFSLQLVVAMLSVVVVTLSTQLRSNTAFTGASLIALMSFGDNLTYIIRMWTTLETSIGAVSRLKSFSEKVKPEDQEGEDVVPPKEWPQRGEIQINGVSASYDDLDEAEGASSRASGESSGSSRHLALKDFSLSAKAGERVAICGRSGSGKSSTLLLLLRLLDPLPSTSQNITIDSVPLHKIDRATLRQRIIAVPQDAVFLPDGTSIKTNLDPSGVASDDECLDVIRAVELAGFVGDRGGLEAGLTADTLSAGQKQLFSLGRAILRRRIRDRGDAASVDEKYAGRGRGGGILLLDEVSSSVDQDTDRAMQAVIQREFEGYTVVMISHRLDMVMGFDSVVIMDKGYVVESGPPKVLVETEGSRFRELWLVQNKE